jgi:hypothetical protein
MTRILAGRLLKSLFAAFAGVIGGSHIFLFLAKLAWHPAWQKFYAFNSELNDEHGEDGMMTSIFTCIFMAMLFMLFVGLPTQAVLQKLRRTRYIVNVGLCTILGALAVWAMQTLIPFTSLEALGFGAGLAFCIASIAWFIRRPDKDSKLDFKPSSIPMEDS